MKCLYCELEALPGKACCQACYTAKSAGRTKSVPGNVEYLRDTSHSVRVGDFVRYAAYGVLLMIGIFVWRQPRAFKNEEVKSVTGAADPCVGRPRCIIFYSAPWCPSCWATKNFMAESCSLINASGKAGCKTVVGLGGTDKENIEMARGISGAVFVDNDAKLARSLGVGPVPHWYLVENGNLIVNDGGGLPGSDRGDTNTVRMFFKQELGSYADKIM